MKKSSLLKLVVVVTLSLVLIASLVSVVFADDNTSFGWDDPIISNEAANNTASTNTTVTNTIDNTNTVEYNSITTTNTTNTTISTGNAITTLNTSTNESENEVNSLAYTGVENNSALVVVILIGAIVAGYSLKKVKEYNNI